MRCTDIWLSWLGEPIFASLALVGDSIYIRAEKHLYRIRAGAGF